MSLKFLKYQNVLYFLKLLKKLENVKTKEREKKIKGIKNFVAVLHKKTCSILCWQISVEKYRVFLENDWLPYAEHV